MKLRPAGLAVVLVSPSVAVFCLLYAALDVPAVLSAFIAFLSAFVWADVWYFVHIIGTVVASPPTCLQCVLDSHEYPAIVGLNDIDRNGHFNNARYLRACNYGRRAFWTANGIWELLCANGGNLLVGAQTVRYRRELTLGQSYTLRTRIRTWDNQAFYIEHQFVTGAEAAGSLFVHAVVLVKNNVMGSKRPQMLMEMRQPGIVAPPVDPDVQSWIDSNAASSLMLRPKKNT
ncbi:hypothetical protein DYB35_002505 [Aphanomyces astaci]|uniref:Thioesterase domain-containing protein n=1 Tax=Aphanomyces astaci TaxID=112090 RepID=A0A3R6WK99_APHAT|nr:hypothetical protein DYB35_002505 [Aphanomyces astaci]